MQYAIVLAVVTLVQMILIIVFFTKGVSRYGRLLYHNFFRNGYCYFSHVKKTLIDIDIDVIVM